MKRSSELYIKDIFEYMERAEKHTKGLSFEHFLGDNKTCDAVIRCIEGLQKDKLSEDTLLGYDDYIQSYVTKINYRREPVSLKYFQYLAVLFAEIVLDSLRNRKIEFLCELNEFLRTYKQEQDIELIDAFTENDLKKLAFWMATGSGKTLIAHINYYQFFHHQLFSPDNIILITPNEGLSKQHFEELQKSGIPCRLYAGSLSGSGTITNEREILVIEMTKFVEMKKGKDVFSDKFEYLKKRGIDFEGLYKKVFGGKGSFDIYELKNGRGEFGLKVSENDYFGVVNISDASRFRKELEKKGISVSQDAISSSLFEVIKKESSHINILIGSKKFIEGWNTWRVSCMGLLNIGRGRGPQIIQLFGRGVRLKGKGMSLKRSDEKTPVQYLEMLNIYGIKADYLNKFLEAIRKEEVEFGLK